MILWFRDKKLEDEDKKIKKKDMTSIRSLLFDQLSLYLTTLCLVWRWQQKVPQDVSFSKLNFGVVLNPALLYSLLFFKEPSPPTPNNIMRRKITQKLRRTSTSKFSLYQPISHQNNIHSTLTPQTRIELNHRITISFHGLKKIRCDNRKGVKYVTLSLAKSQGDVAVDGEIKNLVGGLAAVVDIGIT